jgi:hypothetical protein
VKLLPLFVLAGCLDEPAQPPGGNYELRHTTVVEDLRDSGFADLALIGHAGDPRASAFVLVYNGGPQLFGSTYTALTLAATDFAQVPAWFEPLALSAYRSNNGASGGQWSLVAASAQDPSERPASDGRRVVVTQFPLTNGMFSGPNVHTPFVDANVGGFIDVPRSAYVAARDRPNDTIVEFAYGGNGLMFWGSSNDAQLTQLAEDVSDIVQVRPAVDPAEPFLVVTSAGVLKVSARGPAFTSDGMLPLPIGDHVVRSRVIGTDLVLALTHEAKPSTVTIVTYNTNGATSADLEIPNVPTDLGVSVKPDTKPCLVTLENGELVVYDNIQTTDPTTITATRTTPRAVPNGYDLLAIGAFRAMGDEIYVINSRDPIQPMLCFTYVNGLLSLCI